MDVSKKDGSSITTIFNLVILKNKSLQNRAKFLNHCFAFSIVFHFKKIEPNWIFRIGGV